MQSTRSSLNLPIPHSIRRNARCSTHDRRDYAGEWKALQAGSRRDEEELVLILGSGIVLVTEELYS